MSFSHPASEVAQLAKDVGHEGKVMVASCGSEQGNQEEEEMRQLLADSMLCGNWLIIQNMHLSRGWTYSNGILLTVQVHMYY